MTARSHRPGVRPPGILAPKREPDPLDALQQEILGEQMATLSRLGRRLAEALEVLAACEQGGEACAPGEREARLAEAGEAAWHFVVQREAMGLRNTEAALRHYRVPPAVRLRMGTRRRRP
jgi:hypothetical protein